MKNSDLKSMNNTKANGLKNAHFSKISVPGLIWVIKIRETALYSLEGSIESYYRKETVKKMNKRLFKIKLPQWNRNIFVFCSLTTCALTFPTHFPRCLMSLLFIENPEPFSNIYTTFIMMIYLLILDYLPEKSVVYFDHIGSQLGSINQYLFQPSFWKFDLPTHSRGLRKKNLQRKKRTNIQTVCYSEETWRLMKLLCTWRLKKMNNILLRVWFNTFHRRY